MIEVYTFIHGVEKVNRTSLSQKTRTQGLTKLLNSKFWTNNRKYYKQLINGIESHMAMTTNINEAWRPPPDLWLFISWGGGGGGEDNNGRESYCLSVPF